MHYCSPASPESRQHCKSECTAVLNDTLFNFKLVLTRKWESTMRHEQLYKLCLHMYSSLTQFL